MSSLDSYIIVTLRPLRKSVIKIDSSDVSFDAVPMAKSIQKFMEHNITTDITKHIPRIDKIVVSPSKVKVGEKFKVELILPEGVSSSNLLVEMRESWDRLGFVDLNSKDDLGAIFLAKTAG